VPVLLAYALVGRYQMIDLEAERSFVRKLLAEGLDVYMVDWGLPGRRQRWLTIDDYVSGYLDDCVDFIRERHGLMQINMLGYLPGRRLHHLLRGAVPGKGRRTSCSRSRRSTSTATRSHPERGRAT
jgi:polyhydroxyalkanoate synthase